MRLGISLHCKDKWRIPAPGVYSGHAHATFEQVESGLTPHAAAFGDVIGASIRHPRTRIHHDNFERGKYMPNALELGLDVFCSRHVAIREMPEVELYAGLEAPVERDLVDGDRALAIV